MLGLSEGQFRFYKKWMNHFFLIISVSTTIQPTTTPNAAKDWETHLEIEKILNKINSIECGEYWIIIIIIHLIFKVLRIYLIISLFESNCW
jgi:hypothetical protein